MTPHCVARMQFRETTNLCSPFESALKILAVSNSSCDFAKVWFSSKCFSIVSLNTGLLQSLHKCLTVHFSHTCGLYNEHLQGNQSPRFCGIQSIWPIQKKHSVHKSTAYPLFPLNFLWLQGHCTAHFTPNPRHPRLFLFTRSFPPEQESQQTFHFLLWLLLPLFTIEARVPGAPGTVCLVWCTGCKANLTVFTVTDKQHLNSTLDMERCCLHFTSWKCTV